MGSFLRVCDLSGFVTRAENTKEQWDSSIVERRFWGARPAQDFVRGVKDDQTVPNARPDPPPVFVGPIFTQLTANVLRGATFLPLTSTFGFTAGGTVGIMMDYDNGTLFNTVQVGNPVSNGINIAAGLPYPASSGNQVQAYEAPGP